MTITALIQTRNEATYLADCLHSLAWTDQQVVTDSASTDGTREIALAQGAHLVDLPAATVVEEVRNEGIRLCQGNWILLLDADERVPAKLAAKLRELSKTADADAYALPRRNYFLGQWLEHGFWPDHQTRFFRKGTITWSNQVHSHPEVKGKLRYLPPDPQMALEHPGYGDDLQRFIQKLVRASPVDAQRLQATVQPRIWPYLLRRPLGEFWGRYITCQAWRYGMLGVIWSVLMAYYQFLVCAHYWALIRFSSPSPPPERLRQKVRQEAIREGLKWLLR
ncbi:MAG: glycosyltransferase family 2 protein [Verrucomicrobiota bacterium]